MNADQLVTALQTVTTIEGLHALKQQAWDAPESWVWTEYQAAKIRLGDF